ncbi:transcriptional regulator, LacI family [Paenibacillus curdlanolyticus YK9]|uniref:Transcriptional regulator, LacI family n=1 Tax=Paenibacillus curdlanolyticus YK9 TaxID=717606 RepID=E0IBA3_9BACL|nr:LacI family DNA-binding transcriptional regulator [Paenibacillus curdlanolyticus]EFM10394.1 transcriptional regulator, LacI family [Paenibacillus curdlanolyticus YK9]
MKINIHDVAKKSGLSVVTVSRVLNGSPSVREHNRQKVLEAVKELGYRPNAAARSLSSGRTGIIGVILTTLQDSMFDTVVQRLNEELAMQGYFLAVAVVGNMSEDDSHYLIQEDRVDGLVLLSPLEEDAYIVEMKRRGIPYVLIDNQKPDNDAWSITIDNYTGGQTAARHLLELGHTSIAHLCGSERFRSTRERRSGFLDELQRAGIEPFELVLGDYDVEFGYETTKGWIEAKCLPTAVFAGDDHIALGVINALTEAGLRVPHDVSVIGYDDQTLASKLRPHLTTIRQPADGIAHSAAHMLLSRIGGVHRSMQQKLQPSLIIRNTTAQPRKGTP